MNGAVEKIASFPLLVYVFFERHNRRLEAGGISSR
jgi:hypothetical protein